MFVLFFRLAVAIIMVSYVATIPAYSETLKEAFRMALDTNPRIKIAEVDVGISGQNLAIRRAGVLPSVTATGTTSLSRSKTRDVYSTQKDISASVAISHNLYDGGAAWALINQAQHAEQSSKEQSRAVVQTVMLEVASVFTDYIHDQAIINLRHSDVSLLTKQLEAARQRFDVGEITLTDVATAEARLADAIAELERAKGTLESTRSSYITTVGQRPGRLSDVDLYRRHIPKKLSRAVDIGLSEHPDIVRGLVDLDAAKEGVNAAKAALGPVVGLSGSVSQSRDIDLDTNTSALSFSANVQIPLYAGGSLDAGLERARETERRAAIAVDSARSLVRARVSAAWASYKAAEAQVDAVEARIKAAKAALDGTKEEERVGQKTLLDVLDATKSFISARVSKVQVKRDLTKAAFQLIAAMGRLDTRIVK